MFVFISPVNYSLSNFLMFDVANRAQQNFKPEGGMHNIIAYINPIILAWGVKLTGLFL